YCGKLKRGVDSERSQRSSRRNGLPMIRRDGTFLMRHQHLAGALVELRKITKTASGADGVLHHPPEAFDGIEVVPTMGGQNMEAKLVMIVVEGRVQLIPTAPLLKEP